VDGAQANFAGAAGMSASAAWARAQKQSQLSPNGWKSAMNPKLVSPYEHSRINSRLGGGYADHPLYLFNRFDYFYVNLKFKFIRRKQACSIVQI
jgi:hypothetical protein